MTCSDECAVEKADASEFAFFSGVKNGAIAEQERIIKLLASYWCGEPGCDIHPVRMDWVISAIKGENK